MASESVHGRKGLVAAAVVAAALGIGMLVLQRWVASTAEAAIALVVGWFAAVTLAALAYGRSRPAARAPMLATIGIALVATVAIGYWTGFRKDVVDEDVAMAAGRAGERQASEALSGETRSGGGVGEERGAVGPLEIASGRIEGADGHDASGVASVIAAPGGARTLTLTGFEADPGPDVNVYLSSSADGIEDAIELGDLKGEVGDQQYEIPDDADLRRYRDLVLYCIPFTTRIATAELR